MRTNSTHLLDLPVTDSPRRSWLLRSWIVGCLLATSFCVFKGLEASSSTKPTTRQATVTKEVRRQTRMDEIKEGDVVLARDEFGDTIAQKKVTRVFRRMSDHLRLLTFEARDGTRQTIKTTDEHPFALADSLDFVPAGELAIGTEVPGPNGEIQNLVESLREEHPEGIPVFNFEVESFHTYFVSDQTKTNAILVHNRCELDDLRHQLGDGPEARAVNVRRSLDSLEDHHLLPQHFVDEFESVGLDIEQFKMRLDVQDHRLLPNGLHTNEVWERNWNQRWADFFDEANGNFSPQDVLDQLEQMKLDFFLN